MGNIRPTVFGKIVILIPTFNETFRINDFLSTLTSFFSSDRFSLIHHSSVEIVVVDDGSETPLNFTGGAPINDINIHLLTHSINLGQGAAIQTAMEYARDHLEADSFVTMDADGQHDPEDLPDLLNQLLTANADIVFGNRFKKNSNPPPIRRLILWLAIRFETWITGLKLNDAHNGYRAFNRNFALKMKLTHNRMAHATEFKSLVKNNNFSYAEQPVTIRYSNDTITKGQSNLGSFKILRDLVSEFLFEGD